MPTYDYVCKSCDHRFEEFQAMSAKLLRTCPKCGKKTLERLIGIGAGVLFKGGGFYETDYRSEAYTKAAEAEKKSGDPKSESKSDGAASESKSDAKSDAKSDSKSDSAKSESSSKPDKAEKPASKSKADAPPSKPKKPGAKKND